MLICVYSAQRNTYLTGFCLFLSVVLTRTFYIILDLIHTQEEYAKLKKEACLLFTERVHLLIASTRLQINLAT
jgi:uncharacterized membrane protein